MFLGSMLYQLVCIIFAILVPLSELLVADEVDVWPGIGDEGVRVWVGEAAEGVWAGGRQVRPPHRTLHGVQGGVQPGKKVNTNLDVLDMLVKLEGANMCEFHST